LASAARPLTRRNAKKLQEFLARVREVNSTDYYLYKVRRALVFGSYLSDRDRINDIDIAVELVHRITDPEQRGAADRARIDEAYRAGRRFPHHLAALMWPYQECSVSAEVAQGLR
jgi:predicted nucleotidyltransferase